MSFSKAINTSIATKAFNTAHWKNPKTGLHTSMFTKKTNYEELAKNREKISLCPMIYQQYTHKAYELRVVMFGASYIAARINSQEHEETSVDWRKETIAGKEVSISREYLPKDLIDKCKVLMNLLGIHFGVFDFIVTPEKEYVFLEVNEMGQWLYLEEISDEFPLLCAVTKFIESNDPNFVWSEEKLDTSMSLSNFIKSTHYQQCEDEIWPSHVEPRYRFSYREQSVA